jgi:hypothetical protein
VHTATVSTTPGIARPKPGNKPNPRDSPVFPLHTSLKEAAAALETPPSALRKWLWSRHIFSLLRFVNEPFHFVYTLVS